LTNDYKYDLAISFLQEDEPLALEIADRIGERLSVDVFVYSKRQDDLVGRDGLEAFSGVFGRQSRIVAVLHREGWGGTPWTRVEETAIKNRAFEDGFDFLLLIRLDRSERPKWVPITQLYLGFEKYGVDGTASALEALVQRAGGAVRAESAVDYAGRVARARNFEAERDSWYHSERGVADAVVAAKQTIEAFGVLGHQIEQQHPTLSLSVEESRDACAISNRDYTVVLGWNRGSVVNSLTESYLFAKLFRGYATRRGITFHPPEEIEVVRYDPDIDRTLVPGWRDREAQKFLTANQMADRWLRRFLDLIHVPTDSAMPPNL